MKHLKKFESFSVETEMTNEEFFGGKEKEERKAKLLAQFKELEPEVKKKGVKAPTEEEAMKRAEQDNYKGEFGFVKGRDGKYFMTYKAQDQILGGFQKPDWFKTFNPGSASR